MTWEDLEQKYKIKFKLSNGEFRPIDEWLDDLYLQKTPAEAFQLLVEIMRNAESLFTDLLTHKK